jgi:hypothetical protein
MLSGQPNECIATNFVLHGKPMNQCRMRWLIKEAGAYGGIASLDSCNLHRKMMQQLLRYKGNMRCNGIL